MAATDTRPRPVQERTTSPAVMRAARWKLADVAEHRVYSAGVRWFQEALRDRPGALPLLDFGPQRGRLMSRSFFSRLLNGELEVKSCPESDVSAAQMDLKHLRPEQLVELRACSLDFNTVSASHAAHSNFLEALDGHLAEKLARALLQAEAYTMPSTPVPFRALGRRLLLTVGAAEHMARGWCRSCAAGNSTEEAPPPVPDAWVVELEGEGWPTGISKAIWSSDALQLRPLKHGDSDLLRAVAKDGGLVAIVCDGSYGASAARTAVRSQVLRWEIAMLDPWKEDIFSTVAQLEVTAQQPRNLLKELSAALEKRAEDCDISRVPCPLRSASRGRVANGEGTPTSEPVPDKEREEATAPNVVPVSTSGAADSTAPTLPPASTLEAADDEASKHPAASSSEASDAAVPHAPIVSSSEAVSSDAADVAIRKRAPASTSDAADAKTPNGAPASTATDTIALQTRRDGGRGPRKSLAFLNGSVASALARMRGVQHSSSAPAFSQRGSLSSCPSLQAIAPAATALGAPAHNDTELSADAVQETIAPAVCADNRRPVAQGPNGAGQEVDAAREHSRLDGHDSNVLLELSLSHREGLDGASSCYRPGSQQTEALSEQPRSASQEGQETNFPCRQPSAAVCSGAVPTRRCDGIVQFPDPTRDGDAFFDNSGGGSTSRPADLREHAAAAEQMRKPTTCAGSLSSEAHGELYCCVGGSEADRMPAAAMEVAAKPAILKSEEQVVLRVATPIAPSESEELVVRRTADQLPIARPTAEIMPDGFSAPRVANPVHESFDTRISPTSEGEQTSVQRVSVEDRVPKSASSVKGDGLGLVRSASSPLPPSDGAKPCTQRIKLEDRLPRAASSAKDDGSCVIRRPSPSCFSGGGNGFGAQRVTCESVMPKAGSSAKDDGICVRRNASPPLPPSEGEEFGARRVTLEDRVPKSTSAKGVGLCVRRSASPPLPPSEGEECGARRVTLEDRVPKSASSAKSDGLCVRRSASPPLPPTDGEDPCVRRVANDSQFGKPALSARGNGFSVRRSPSPPIVPGEGEELCARRGAAENRLQKPALSARGDGLYVRRCASPPLAQNEGEETSVRRVTIENRFPKTASSATGEGVCVRRSPSPPFAQSALDTWRCATLDRASNPTSRPSFDFYSAASSRTSNPTSSPPPCSEFYSAASSRVSSPASTIKGDDPGIPRIGVQRVPMAFGPGAGGESFEKRLAAPVLISSTLSSAPEHCLRPAVSHQRVESANFENQAPVHHVASAQHLDASSLVSVVQPGLPGPSDEACVQHVASHQRRDTAKLGLLTKPDLVKQGSESFLQRGVSQHSSVPASHISAGEQCGVQRTASQQRVSTPVCASVTESSSARQLECQPEVATPHGSMGVGDANLVLRTAAGDGVSAGVPSAAVADQALQRITSQPHVETCGGQCVRRSASLQRIVAPVPPIQSEAAPVRRSASTEQQGRGVQGTPAAMSNPEGEPRVVRTAAQDRPPQPTLSSQDHEICVLRSTVTSVAEPNQASEQCARHRFSPQRHAHAVPPVQSEGHSVQRIPAREEGGGPLVQDNRVAQAASESSQGSYQCVPRRASLPRVASPTVPTQNQEHPLQQVAAPDQEGWRVQTAATPVDEEPRARRITVEDRFSRQALSMQDEETCVRRLTADDPQRAVSHQGVEPCARRITAQSRLSNSAAPHVDEHCVRGITPEQRFAKPAVPTDCKESGVRRLVNKVHAGSGDATADTQAVRLRRGGGRCPRPSVAFLSGAVAGAVARMEGHEVE